MPLLGRPGSGRKAEAFGLKVGALFFESISPTYLYG